MRFSIRRVAAVAALLLSPLCALAGPVINGYAFCNLATQQELHAKAVAWVESNPYEVMFMARPPRHTR